MLCLVRKRVIMTKTILFDVETSHSIVATFGLHNENIPHENILSDFFIICASWKWLDEDEIYSVSLLDDIERFNISPNDDYYVADELRKAISEANLVIGHNHKKFDTKKLNAKLCYHKLPPLEYHKDIDTLKVARQYFKFTSNRLDYLAKYLGVGEKMRTSRGLWLRVLMGDVEAIKEMAEYNKVDVKILEGVYLRLRPYMKTHPNLISIDGKQVEKCTSCDSPHIQYRGTAINQKGKFRRFQCQECGAWSQSTKPMVTT